jgi:hypothetical protein
MYFGIYLAMMTLSILFLQIYNPGKQIREALHPETMTESVFEEPDSDSDAEEEAFDPTKESFTMTENPMLRHRNLDEGHRNVAEGHRNVDEGHRTVEETEAKPIRLEDVD